MDIRKRHDGYYAYRFEGGCHVYSKIGDQLPPGTSGQVVDESHKKPSTPISQGVVKHEDGHYYEHVFHPQNQYYGAYHEHRHLGTTLPPGYQGRAAEAAPAPVFSQSDLLKVVLAGDPHAAAGSLIAGTAAKQMANGAAPDNPAAAMLLRNWLMQLFGK